MPLPLIDEAVRRRDRIAVAAPEGVFTYADLLDASARVAAGLLERVAKGRAVCVLVPPGQTWVATTWGAWRAGGIAVPLAVSHPPPEHARVLDDVEPLVVVADPTLAHAVEGPAAERGAEVVAPAELMSGAAPDPSVLPDVGLDDPALVLYTSGTTGRPKGVVLSHGNVEAQVRTLVEAWEWTADDHILLHLPLHHVHGIVNVLTCALRSGAVCQILARFDAVEVWERLARGDVTLYMAVPTVYRRLIDAWEAADARTRARWSDGAGAARLMVSGSAALPVPTLERWEAITGHRLLERYGMTEIGMALSNPLHGERRPGHVGRPLPRVELRLVDDEDGRAVPAGTPGLIEVRGPSVFERYWRRPDATAEAFTADGWFRTGDRAVVEDGSYRILGRESVDILKTGGEKVSAREIGAVLRQHPGVADCAVVGVPDPEWGERVCAAVVPTSAAGGPGAAAGPGGPVGALDPGSLQALARERLAPYKVPKEIVVVDDLPRNAMGKVTKPAVRELFGAPPGRDRVEEGTAPPGEPS